MDFVVRSRGATAMSLLLARAPREGAAGSQGRPSGCLEIALDPTVNRTGDLWHICVEVQPHKRAHVLRAPFPGHLAQLRCCKGRAHSHRWERLQGLKDLGTLCYAWRADAEVAWEGGGRFYPGDLCMLSCAPRSLPAILSIQWTHAIDAAGQCKSSQLCNVCKSCLQMCSMCEVSARRRHSAFHCSVGAMLVQVRSCLTRMHQLWRQCSCRRATMWCRPGKGKTAQRIKTILLL